MTALRRSFLIYLFLLPVCLQSQGFEFEKPSAKRVVIPFKLINNLIFIPLTVNGSELTFLLDTGVSETILFSLEENQQVGLSDVRKVKLIGLGGSETVEGLVSAGNTIGTRGFIDRDHEIYIVLDQGFNFSSNVGIPVNGIIGYHFFRNHAVEIDFERRRLIVHRTEISSKKSYRKYDVTSISIEGNKPYVQTSVDLGDGHFDSKLLIDLGNSDAVWLFPEKLSPKRIPERNFIDFLGRGLSGDINGKRARLKEFDFCGFGFRNLIGAFPEDITTKSITMVENRVGSVGAEILKRFRIVFDFPNQKMYLKKSRLFDDPFNYNMSGIEIHHEGVTWVREQVELITVKHGYDLNNDTPNAFSFKFKLKPLYVIANVRPDSPAEESGLKKGDILVSINGSDAFRYTLQELNTLLKSEEGKKIDITVDRKGVILKYSFRLKSIL